MEGDMAEGKYWDPKRPLSYNCLYNFIIGNRGAGKTFGGLSLGIDRFLASGQQFIYVRRHDTELEKLTKMRGGRIFNSHRKFYPGHELKAESNVLYCDGDVMGYAVPLSTASKLKSDSFPDVTLIIFDEFIIDNSGTYHYLKDEVRLFNDLYETVARPGSEHPKVTVLFLSNAVSITNPYFDYYHLDKPKGSDIQRFGPGKLILVQNVVSQAMVEAKASHDFYKLNAGTEYYDYAVLNDWLMDNEDFIEHKTQRAQYFLTLRYKDTWIGVWRDYLQGLFYVSADVDMQYRHVFSATTDDHKPNVMLFRAGAKQQWLKLLIEAYENGCVRYETVKLKNWFRDIMRMSRG